MTKQKDIELSNLQTAFEAYKKEIPAGSFFRYTHGIFPKIIRFIAKRPPLAQALWADVQKYINQSTN